MTENTRVPSITFPPHGAELSNDDKMALVKLAGMLKSNGGRVQLLAYPASGEAQESDARARSFTRALVVRGYLVSQGVLAENIEVRLQSAKPSEGSTDRVDPVIVPKSDS